MALVGKLSGLNRSPLFHNIRNASTLGAAPRSSTSRKRLLGLLGGVAAGGAGLVLAMESSLKASGNDLHPFELPWSHNGLFGQLDTAGVRRGWQVYKQVCAACHSLKAVRYFHMINVCLTEAEARAEAADQLFEDGPNDEGKMFKRPGKLADFVASPYPNAKAAAAANNGAIPPELSMIVNARHGGEDYVFWLLMGYPEEAYNPYFSGGVIGMPRQLYNEGIEYEDGTIATASQQAKDVSVFLKWTADRHHDWRKQAAFKIMVIAGIFGTLSLYMTRSVMKAKHLDKLAFRVVPGREPHVARDHKVASVFESEAAKMSDRAPQFGEVPSSTITATTRHLYKSYAPRYVWKNKWPMHEQLREWNWKYNWWGYRLGLLYDDHNYYEDDCPTVREAVSRLSPWEKDARERRMIRATMLSANNEWLPKSEWTKYEDETWYLQPHLEQLEKEKWDRTLANMSGKPAWHGRHHTNMTSGKGKAPME